MAVSDSCWVYPLDGLHTRASAPSTPHQSTSIKRALESDDQETMKQQLALPSPPTTETGSGDSSQTTTSPPNGTSTAQSFVDYEFPVRLKLHLRRSAWWKWPSRRSVILYLFADMYFDELREEINHYSNTLYDAPSMKIESHKIWVRIKQGGPRYSGFWVRERTCRVFMGMLQKMVEQGDQPQIDIWVRQPATEEERMKALAERERSERRRRYD